MRRRCGWTGCSTRRCPPRRSRCSPSTRAARGARALERFVTDLMFWAPAVEAAAGHATVAPVWMYRFDFAPPALRAVGLGAAHGLELDHVMARRGGMTRRLATLLGGDRAARALTGRMSGAWLAVRAHRRGAGVVAAVRRRAAPHLGVRPRGPARVRSAAAASGPRGGPGSPTADPRSRRPRDRERAAHADGRRRVRRRYDGERNTVPLVDTSYMSREPVGSAPSSVPCITPVPSTSEPFDSLSDIG